MKECKKKDVRFFFKQWGKKHFNSDPDDPTIEKSNPLYAKGGCQIDGKIYREMPEIQKDA